MTGNSGENNQGNVRRRRRQRRGKAFLKTTRTADDNNKMQRQRYICGVLDLWCCCRCCDCCLWSGIGCFRSRDPGGREANVQSQNAAVHSRMGCMGSVWLVVFAAPRHVSHSRIASHLAVTTDRYRQLRRGSAVAWCQTGRVCCAPEKQKHVHCRTIPTTTTTATFRVRGVPRAYMAPLTDRSVIIIISLHVWV